MMKIFDKINFREPKYMLPAVLYIPLLVASYFIFDLFHTE
ncbi:conjugative transposon protein TraM, partial [Bacteroides thetaiotaomicron]